MDIDQIKMDIENRMLDEKTDIFYKFLKRNVDCPNVEKHFVCPKANPCRCKGVCSINQRKIGDPKPEKADFYINQIEEYRLYNLNLATDLNQLRENHLNDSQMVKFKDDEARFQSFYRLMGFLAA